jgi:hypothetical protein
MIPSSTQLVDGAGNIWTVVGGVIYENGLAQGVTQQVILLLYYGGAIYQENSHCMWWSWTAGAWTASSQPAIGGIPACGGSTSASSGSTSSSTGGTSTSTSGTGTSTSGTSTTGTSTSGSGSTSSHPAASASGAMIPVVSKLVDSAGNSWTVNGGVISLDGAAQTVTQRVIVLLYYNGVIYQENSNCGWWSWTAGAWVASAKPSAGGIPACSSTVSSATSTSSTSTSTTGNSSSSSDAGVPAPAAAVG